MALLLQGHLGLPDWDAVETAVMDPQWQMVLGCLGATEPPFSQGALQGFRERLIALSTSQRGITLVACPFVELRRNTTPLCGKEHDRSQWSAYQDVDWFKNLEDREAKTVGMNHHRDKAECVSHSGPLQQGLDVAPPIPLRAAGIAPSGG